MLSLASGKTTLTDQEFKAADVDRDGSVTVKDAQLILRYYMYNTMLDVDVSWELLIAAMLLSTMK